MSLLRYPAIVPDAANRRPEQVYIPAQSMVNGQDQNGHGISDSLQPILQARPTPSPALSTSGMPRESRGLPSKVVTDDNFDEAYVKFIMYCNPVIPLDTDTEELRRIFRSPPKSDGKTFNTFTLFELIQKLEEKEIKTWAQLAIDLGVEPPALDKGQSAQKVQQYAVRLKVSFSHPW